MSLSEIQKKNGPVGDQQGSKKETDSVKAGKKWECLTGKDSDCLSTLKSLPKSNKFWIALIIAGAVGFGVAAVGATSVFSHMNMLPQSVAKLNALGAIGNHYAIAMIVAGGAFSLLGIAATIVLVKRHIDKKQEAKKEEVKKTKQKEQKLGALESRQRSFEALPQYIKDKGPMLVKPGAFVVVEQPTGKLAFAKFAILWSTESGFKLEENISKDGLQARIDHHKNILGLEQE